MTTLPERLRASAQEMRRLFLVSENVPNVRMIYKEDRDRIAAELLQAADALEAGPLTLDQRYWLDRRAEIIAALAADGLQICSDKEKVWLRRNAAAPAAQVAQEGGGVATRHPRCGYPYCACVGECFAASQPGVTAGVTPPTEGQPK